MSAVGVWDKVEVLVHRTADGRLETDRSTLDHLSSITSPVHVVAVVGPYRTGKSHLLNIIIEALFGKTNVFPVGNTVQALTKGITVWCSPHPSVRGHWIIFLDTEGLNDVEQGDRDSDVLIFVLTVLLSSVLVYNSNGVIDFHALETIHHVSVLAEKIRLMPADLSEDLEDIGFDLAFPELLWVVRDFQLNLEVNGTRITDDNYLENALSTSKMVLDPKKSTVVSVKRCIKEYFTRRKCFLLPNLLQLNDPSATGGAHQPERTSDLIDQISMAECKMHRGSAVTGRVLGQLAEELVVECQRLNLQEPVNVQDIMDRISEKENNAAVAKSLHLYGTDMSEQTAEAVDEVTLHQIHLRCSELATNDFMHDAVYPVEDAFKRLMNEIKLAFEKISVENAAKIEKLCNETFRALRKEIIGDNNTRYYCSGGFQKYREDMTELRKRWEQIPVLQGITGRSFFGKKMNELRESEGRLIMDADKSMTELKRQETVERQKQERKRLEELKKQKDETTVNALERDRNAFEHRVKNQVRGTILRPDEAEISKLNCRISVLDRELSDLRARHAEDEAETCEQRLKTYKRMVSEKQNQPSKWKKVSSSIQSFARGTLDSLRRLLKLPPAETMPHCAATVATPDTSSPSVLSASPVPTRSSSCVPSSTSPGASTAAASGSSSSKSAAASTAALPCLSSATPASSTAASPVFSSKSAVVSTAVSHCLSSAPPVASASNGSSSSIPPAASVSPGSSSVLPAASASLGSLSVSPAASYAASSGSSLAPPVASTAASPVSASALPLSSSVPSCGSSLPAADSVTSASATPGN